MTKATMTAESPEWHKRLQRLVDERTRQDRTSVRQIEREAHVGDGTIRRALANPHQNPRRDTLEKIARALGVNVTAITGFGVNDSSTINRVVSIPVVERVEAFTFVAAKEAALGRGGFVVTVPDDPAFSEMHRFGAEMLDFSMDEMYPFGSVLVCVRTSDWPGGAAAVGPGRRVLVRNWRGGRFETLCREVVERDGQRYLWPRSAHPDFQVPIPLPPTRAGGAESAPGFEHPAGNGMTRPDGPEIVAVVVGCFRSEPPP